MTASRDHSGGDGSAALIVAFGSGAQAIARQTSAAPSRQPALGIMPLLKSFVTIAILNSIFTTDEREQTRINRTGKLGCGPLRIPRSLAFIRGESS
jgi:hypothetical protein